MVENLGVDPVPLETPKTAVKLVFIGPFRTRGGESLPLRQ
jgi:hypothetical protein